MRHPHPQSGTRPCWRLESSLRRHLRRLSHHCRRSGQRLWVMILTVAAGSDYDFAAGVIIWADFALVVVFKVLFVDGILNLVLRSLLAGLGCLRTGRLAVLGCSVQHCT